MTENYEKLELLMIDIHNTKTEVKLLEKSIELTIDSKERHDLGSVLLGERMKLMDLENQLQRASEN